MQQSNLQFLLQLQRDSELVRDKANDLANQLIIEFDINEGYQIARFLKLSEGLDNYTAVRVWTEKWLKQYYPLYDEALIDDLKSDDTLYPKLKTKFFSHFPEIAVA